jgi:parvulin-like peptidyl-prolyl isomerase
MIARPIRTLLLAALAATSPAASAFGPAPVAAAERPAAQGEIKYAFVKAPLFSEQFAAFPVARVEDEVITLEELNEQLATAHSGRTGGAEGGLDFAPFLDRLVDLRLIVLEAKEMGIDAMPEVAEPIQQFRQATLREMVKARATKDVKPDPAEVKKLVEARTREYRVKSVLLPKEDDARWMQAELAAGKPFDELATVAAAERGAQLGTDDYTDPRKMLPEVVAAVEETPRGVVSPPVKLAQGFAFLRVDGVRYREDADVRKEAERASFNRLAEEALWKHYQGLAKRYAKMDQVLLKSLDYGAAKPGFQALAIDKRALVRIQGAKPVTVGELSKELEKQFFHGPEEAAKGGKVNAKKESTLDNILYRRLLEKEAARLRIAEGEEYKRRVSEFTRSTLFGAFMQKVIVPEVRVTDEQAKEYYQKHQDEFAYPPFYRLQGLAFAKAKDAQAAVEKLRAGTDLKWLKANAAGQVASPSVVLDETPLSRDGLEQDLARVLQGARTGDVRLWQKSEAEAYAVSVLEAIPASHRPFEEARGEIGKKLFAESLGKAIRDWGAKLRKVRDVKVYLTRIGS